MKLSCVLKETVKTIIRFGLCALLMGAILLIAAFLAHLTYNFIVVILGFTQSGIFAVLLFLYFILVVSLISAIHKCYTEEKEKRKKDEL